ncbi:DHA2 family efflux MFS transporter permease subunit [Tunturiibacter gelidoferens]|jgi:EmrB/QacA subfamily drug resistance transporter|uniref:EmrB/QacA subfamily drug resistance transporter n=1 Tax=Tunturiibacter gelidiferens TaxID=3069689 RepID=A0A9X0QC23_9BACT|nr:DHA2 family efflux MFS transporter permease subunit [Edaphobacter lichenicola]MBB5327515.1 EmrB/QacA subfamily drug resistance transporter [Edaphobacter lichenicola]
MNPSNLSAVGPPVQVPSEASKHLLPWLVAFAFFMESLDTTILNTAVPAISAALDVKPLSMKAVLASYTLSLAVFIPISGWVADRFGTRRVFAAAIGLFTFGSFLCGISTNIDALVACRILQGMGGSMMVPVGRMTLVRTFSKSDLLRAMSFVSIPALVAPMLGPIAGGLIVAYLHWRFIFFVNIPIGLAGLVLVYLYLPDYREKKTHPLDVVGLILFGSGIALLSYVLEVFGDHTLGVREITGLLVVSLALLAGYWIHAKTLQFPLLQLNLFRIRTFRAAVGGGLFTRLGIGGVPFLLPLLYQVGLGFTPIQSGLLLMPQALAAIGVNWVILRLLARFGYRSVLITNTIIIGMLLLVFATIGVHTPIWVIVALAFLYGAYSSLQYTSMNTLVYADTTEEETSAANSIFSTVQQMAISFGVATAGLATAFFIPEHSQSNPALMIDGLHKALLSLGVLTILSTTVFGSLKKEDGRAVSQQKAIHPGG